MKINVLKLEERVALLRADKDQSLANANAMNGAILELERILNGEYCSNGTGDSGGDDGSA